MTRAAGWLTQDRGDLPGSLDWLADDERARLAGLRIAKRRDDFVLGRWTAKRAIAARLAPAGALALEAIAIRAAADGAPEAFLDGAPLPVTVSLSHSAGRALAAVGDPGAALGADLERVEPRSALLVDDFFTAEEAALVAAWPPGARDRAITLIWSAKESALKARRTGLREDPRRVRVRLDGGGDAPGTASGIAPGTASGIAPGVVSGIASGLAAGAAWRPLRIAIDGERGELAGWWRDDAGHVLTIVGEGLAAPVGLHEVAGQVFTGAGDALAARARSGSAAPAVHGSGRARPR